ncbi:ras guanine nucleotide exchange factor domain-containing protein [Pilobolus umbonatus]|nr:ras guanine nucleotide exchange factor domain-containing protein [Pilobolus umbonatus]
MVVILLEIIEGKPQIVAGTDDKLFEKLFDKTMQEIDYIDIYLVNHTDFITSETLLSQLIIRFSTQLPGEDYNYQEKVLEIISHWVFFQSEDFRCNDALERQLTSFLSDKNILLNHRKEVEAIMINLNKKSYLTNKYTAHPTSHLACSVTSFNLHSNNSSLPPVHFSHNPIKPYGLFDITPPDSPTTYISSLSSIINIESKDIARYLTLADYYLFKSIRSHHLFRTKISHPTDEHKEEPDFIHLMTKRANMLTHWVAHEICSMTQLKLKRALLRKFIDVAKLCYEWNNFHTCMVIIMGLTSLSNLIETWDSLSNRDMNTFDSLSKLLDVSLNMRYYRQKIKSAKSPCIPFLPVVLKDFTFYNENPTYLLSHPDLINFAKFRSVYQFILQTKSLTEEEYWFASELIHFPFMPIPMPSSSIMNSFNQMADWIECRLDRVESCYLHCSLLS